jgi:hypothetical protein
MLILLIFTLVPCLSWFVLKRRLHFAFALLIATPCLGLGTAVEYSIVEASQSNVVASADGSFQVVFGQSSRAQKLPLVDFAVDSQRRYKIAVTVANSGGTYLSRPVFETDLAD